MTKKKKTEKMQNIRMEKEQDTSGFLGTLLPVIITLIILQTSFPFIFDTLHLVLIICNFCVNTAAGHIVYKT